MQAASDILARLHPCGTLQRDGLVVGCWFVTGVFPWSQGRSRLEFLAVGLTADHHLLSGRTSCGDGQDVEACARELMRPVCAVRCHPSALRGLDSRSTADLTTVRDWVRAPKDRLNDSVQAMLREVMTRRAGAEDRHRDDFDACAGHATAVAKVLDGFLATLDPRALEIAGRNADAQVGLNWAWGALDRNLDPEAPLAEALTRHPLLVRRITACHAEDPVTFRAAVSSGQPLDLLAHVLGSKGLPRWRLSSIAECERALVASEVTRDADSPLSARSMARSSSGVPIELTRLLDRLPPSWVPQDQDEWDAFADLYDLVCYVSPRMPGDDASVVLNAGGRWRDLARRLGGVFPGVPLVQSYLDSTDVSMAYGREVIGAAFAVSGTDVPRGVSPEDHDAWFGIAETILWSGRSLTRRFEESRDWHGHDGPRRALLASLPSTKRDPGRPETDDWGRGLPDDVRDGIAVVVLASVRELVAEGASGQVDGTSGLGHCVAGHGPLCRSGQVRVLSVRRVRPDGGFERLSTAEVGTGVGYPLRQHRGFRNAMPGAEARRTLDGYLDRVRTGRLGVDEDALVPVPDASQDLYGYDPSCGGNWERVRDAWDRHLPGPMRGLDAVTLAAVVKRLIETYKVDRWEREVVTPDVLTADHPVPATKGP